MRKSDTVAPTAWPGTGRRSRGSLLWAWWGQVLPWLGVAYLIVAVVGKSSYAVSHLVRDVEAWSAVRIARTAALGYLPWHAHRYVPRREGPHAPVAS